MGKWQAKKTMEMAFSDFLAVAFGIPLGLQGKPLTTVQLASCALSISYQSPELMPLAKHG